MSKDSLEIYFKVPSAWMEESLNEVSKSLPLKIVFEEPEKKTHFIFDEEGLSFSDPDLGLIHLDFVEDHIRYRRKGHRGKSELIVKALGLERKTDLMVDATVGLGADSMFIVQLGYSVIGFERSPIVYLLLKDALRRWEDNKSERSGSFEVIFGDAATGISQIQNDIRAIYVDPMFPEKKKSALPKKRCKFLRNGLARMRILRLSCKRLCKVVPSELL